MVTRGIREFVGRDWRAVRKAKDAYWAERIARLGPIEGWRLADELRRQVQVQDPFWPDQAERDLDLSAHVRLTELFSRAGSTRRA
jgi:hypothetical protein